MFKNIFIIIVNFLIILIFHHIFFNICKESNQFSEESHVLKVRHVRVHHAHLWHHFHHIDWFEFEINSLGK